MKIINPATEEVIEDVQEDNIESLNKKFKLLVEGQKKWSAIDLDARINIIDRFSELLESEKEKSAHILTSEVGKPLQQSRNEINGARGRIKWLTENAAKYL